MHTFAVILDTLVVQGLLGNSLGLETFVALGMLTYSAFMEKKAGAQVQQHSVTAYSWSYSFIFMPVEF